MTATEISRAADAIFASIRPVNWAIRPQQDQEDYGIDFEIELITPDDKPTGFIFKIQQKSVLVAEVNSAGDTISFRDLTVQKVHYYLYLERVAITQRVGRIPANHHDHVPLVLQRHFE
jgi:hydroxypyruvate isomerase